VFSATANFHIGGLRNTLIVGGDASYQNADRTIYAYTLPPTSQYFYALGDHSRSRSNIGISLFNPSHLPPPGYNVVLPTVANSTGTNAGATNATATTVVTSSGRATDLAFFATDRLWLDETLSIIAGVRVDRYNATFNSVTVAGTPTSAKSPSTLVNPRASLVWEPDQKTTVYFSYGKSSVPIGTSVVGAPTPISTANQALDPEESETLEVGAKYSMFDGALGLTASAFKILKSNAVLTDPTSGNIQLQSGQKQRVQGVELSATGKITDDLAVTAAYTYLDPVITYDLSCGTATPIVCKPNPFTIGKQIFFVPKNAASIWMDYSAKALLEGLTFGGGLVYQSKLFNAITTAGTAPDPTGISRIATIPETIELDAVAAYDFGGAYRVQLNVNNLTDRLNYSQSFGNRGTPSPGRTFIVSLEAAL
jgi:catecholate siderophore receptor